MRRFSKESEHKVLGNCFGLTSQGANCRVHYFNLGLLSCIKINFNCAWGHHHCNIGFSMILGLHTDQNILALQASELIQLNVDHCCIS